MVRFKLDFIENHTVFQPSYVSAYLYTYCANLYRLRFLNKEKHIKISHIFGLSIGTFNINENMHTLHQPIFQVSHIQVKKIQKVISRLYYISISNILLFFTFINEINNKHNKKFDCNQCNSNIFTLLMIYW